MNAAGDSRAARRDRRLLYAASLLRATATGMIAVLLGLYLAERELDGRQIGTIVGTGLAGAACAALLVTLWGDRLGRRATLAVVAVLSAAGVALLCFASDARLLAAIAFLGMLNGMGRDRGAALILEQAILPGTAGDRQRTAAFARYHLLQDAGHALGAALAGLAGTLHERTGLNALDSQRALLGAGAALLLLTALAAAGLSRQAERDGAPGGVPAGGGLAQVGQLSAGSRRVLARISSLFFVDALGGGFLTTAWLSWFFVERFGVSPQLLGGLFFAARALNALSHLGAAALARRIGLVNTMVFTHIPSSLLLVTVAFAPSFPVAAVLFLLREGLVEMDVPTRQSYVMALVAPAERTLASGVTHLVRLGGWALGPLLAGWTLGGLPLMVPLVVGAALKLGYDLALWRGFRALRPPEERGA
ncbi:MAG TPA: MFS transporter [Planctomycetota bacterium]|nr:MFS transporter [Planctomycetota bacterium]